ncbi:MAG: sigma-E factor negative regulatory protein [Acidiferrobacteraceae bacterium]
MKERLSSLIDAELDGPARAQAISEVSGDRDLRSAWERYHVIRLVMRHEIEWTLSPGFPEEVAARIDREEGDGRRPTRSSWMAGRNGWVSRLAIAASVAALVLFGLRTNDRLGSQGTPLAVSVARLSPAGSGQFSGLNGVQDTAFHGGSVRRWREARLEWRRRLNAYLVEHNELAPEAGGDFAGYVRVVGYGHIARASSPVKK